MTLGYSAKTGFLIGIAKTNWDYDETTPQALFYCRGEYTLYHRRYFTGDKPNLSTGQRYQGVASSNTTGTDEKVTFTPLS